MFDDLIISHKQKLSQTIGLNKRYSTLNEILANQQIDDGYKTFFNAEVNWWIYEEQIRRNLSQQFDFSSGDFPKFLADYDSQLYSSSRFDRSTLKAVIESAVKTRLNLLIRPRVSLKWFVFRGEPTKPYHEILKRLNYFYDYEYLTKGIVNHINENKFIRSDDDLISVIEFTNIIEKVDTDYLFGLQPEQFVQLLFPMISYIEPDETVVDFKTEFPIEALIIFLDDKGIEPLKASAEHLLRKKSVNYINGEMFLQLIYQLLNEIDNTEPNPINDEQLDELNTGYQELLDMTHELGTLDKALKEMKEEQKGE
jgi:hypothetical protein